MAYKEFTAGQEALAADVNTLYMQQTVARFPTAAARTAAIVSPALNQLSMLDDRSSVLQRWNGSSWTDMPGSLNRQATALFGGLVSTAQDISLATFTMPFSGVIYLNGVARIDPGGSSTSKLVALFDVSPVSVPVTTGPQFVGPVATQAEYYVSLPFMFKWSGVAAGTACNLKLRVSSNSLPFTLTNVTFTISLIGSEF